jgi:spoIIIJ-associated protein
MEVVEKRGKSINEAIASALAELECSREEAEVEILEEPGKGFLGIFAGKLAWVRVSRKPTPAPRTEKKPAVAVDTEFSHGEEVRQLLETILGKMDINYEIEALEATAERVRANFIGADMGLLVGRKGETLNALQLITGLIYNRQAEYKTRIVLDVEDYRLKREKSLEDLARSLAEKVKQTQKSVIMRSMSAQERRVVHTALQQDTELTTYSIGDDPNRKVVIAVKKNT